MIASLLPLLERAERGRYALPAFNVTNLETVQAVLSAAAAVRSPVIIQTSEGAIEYAGHTTILEMMESVAATHAKKVPVVTHLDHGKHFNILKRCIALGYRSVHMDASEQSWEKNCALTKQAVVFGHKHRVAVQGELGYLLGYEGMTKIHFDRRKLRMLMTDPVKAAEFVAYTGVDTLAIAVGTAHGYFKGKEKIDFERLTAIRRRVRVPLVLHGGSGVEDHEIRKAIASGIRIINLDTTLRLQFMSGLRTAMQSYAPKKKVDIRPIL
ncbi:MAG: class II fructose-bisphosphate aldolase, partial [Candidatus Komeilibacteria bacterium]|nr:class II fructose-bisphosphate aldolase [Candidatus Komeilibacteria bacterium]